MLTTVISQGRSEFSRYQRDWDQLCAAADTSSPFLDSRCLISACEEFCPNGDLTALIVKCDDNQVAAGLPLVCRRQFGQTILELPNNDWGVWGDLLVNASIDTDSVFEGLAKGINQISHTVLRLNLIEADALRWKRFLQHLKNNGRALECRPAYSIGIVEHDQSWTDFRSRLSKGMRKRLNKSTRLLENEGAISFETVRQFDERQLEQAFARIDRIEQRSWKADESTTIADHQMTEFLTEQVGILADAGKLLISFLQVDDRDVAFEIGVISKRVYFSYKIGYDKRYSSSSPGHLLAEYLTRQFHEENSCDLQDTVGPISNATARWSSSLKHVSNVTISGTTTGSKAVLHAAYAVKAKLRGRQTVESIPTPCVKPACVPQFGDQLGAAVGAVEPVS